MSTRSTGKLRILRKVKPMGAFEKVEDVFQMQVRTTEGLPWGSAPQRKWVDVPIVVVTVDEDGNLIGEADQSD